ncbi:TonB-dependent receptor domain-containing protein [Saccharicrinis sp. GN24d3]|uniref:TonB-dependent receptor domain-containing protein n=1 Tax=Saccharicrinis sp. GN24d3 TaxID=3458416 RepID=UPI0040365171
MKNLWIVFFVFVSMLSQAQNGKIRGTVIEDATGETLVGVTVFIKGTTTGNITDLDGRFSIDLPEGTYDVQVSYISYETTVIEEVQVKENDVTVIGDVRLGQNIQDIEEVVVKAKVIRTTETALQTMKKKSTVMLDGISAGKIQLIGDATAVEAAKRITGVSIQDGKYVYVRGLGDRYSKTTLNGMEIPGLDPDRNSIQMDIFPTHLINNMVVSKNFTADLPADFTGGIMNVETKDFPERKIFSVSVGSSYNPDMHFKPNNLSYEGGDLDFLGLDDGSRSMPTGARVENIPSPISGHGSQEVTRFINSFDPELGATKETSLMDFSLGLTLGNQVDLAPSNEKRQEKSPKLGYVFSASYKSKNRFYEDRKYGEYQLNKEPNVNELVYSTVRTGDLGEQEVLIGLLGGVAYKTNVSKFRFTAMHLQSGESKAGFFHVDNNPEAIGQSGYLAKTHNLEYNQRSLSNAILNGTHVLNEKGWELDWRVSPTLSRSEDPDIRKTPFSIVGDGFEFSAGEGGNPSRIWRALNEINLSNKVDVTKKYTFKGLDAKVKFGASYTYKNRSYEIVKFDIVTFGGNTSWPTSDANQVLLPENMYPNGHLLYYQTDYSNPNANEYESNASNMAFYASNEFKVLPKLTTTIGLRVESFTLHHTGRDQAGARGSSNGNVLANEKVLDSFDLFPSLNFIYSITDEQNLRMAYSRTTARPSFKELSYAQIIDPISNSIFNGGLHAYGDWDGNLVSTYINNADLRWELFMRKGQMVSLSGFYKSFTDPIELVRIPEQQTSTEYQPRNVGDGQLFGIEFEFRKNLDFLTLNNINVNGNVTMVDSKIEMTDTELDSRKGQARDGQSIDNNRVMAGQASYLVNAGIVYGKQESGLDVGLFYNVKGETLTLVGGGVFPDVYTKPFHSLNFSLNKKIGAQKRMLVEFKASNILGNEVEEIFKSYKAKDQTFKRYNPGRSFSIGFKYKI